MPLLAMWAATLLPEGVRGAMNQATQAAPAGESYLNLLPQADEHDRAVFLSRYFGLENKDYVKRFLQMNRGITILEDYSAGSNATTMLCMDTQSTFYRKYAFGKDGAKLAEQLDWLRAQQDRLPLCDILRSEEADGCCWYDMVYNPQAVGMFRYLHSNPVEKSRAILRAVLATLEDKLYKPTAVPADAEKIEIENIRDAGQVKPEKKERTVIPHPGLGEGGKYHEKETEHPLPDTEVLTFALAGNQNCGKTTLFNQLTGSSQHVGNFPGVTVDRKDGTIRGKENTLVTDLPGIYSMSPYSSEEIVTRNFVLKIGRAHV